MRAVYSKLLVDSGLTILAVEKDKVTDCCKELSECPGTMLLKHCSSLEDYAALLELIADDSKKCRKLVVPHLFQNHVVTEVDLLTHGKHMASILRHILPILRENSVTLVGVVQTEVPVTKGVGSGHLHDALKFSSQLAFFIPDKLVFANGAGHIDVRDRTARTGEWSPFGIGD